MTLTRDRSDRPDQRGMTLIELLVSLSVASVLLAGVAAVFVATLRGVTTTTVKTSTGADVRIAIEAMTRTLKVAKVPYGEDSAFTAASTTGIEFYALLNRTGTDSANRPIPTRVRYSWTGECVQEDQTPGASIANPDDGGPYYTWTTGTTSRCLLRTVTAPKFTYYASGLVTATAIAGNPLGSASFPLIRSVGLYLTATDKNNSSVAGVPAQNRVTLENLLVTSEAS